MAYSAKEKELILRRKKEMGELERVWEEYKASTIPYTPSRAEQYLNKYLSCNVSWLIHTWTPTPDLGLKKRGRLHRAVQ